LLRKRAIYGNKDSHIAWNAFLHYLVKYEDSKMKY